MKTQILLVTTSHNVKGSTGQPTGAYLPEVAHPFAVFTRAGYSVRIASVGGGRVPLDGVEDADDISRAFLAEHRPALNDSLAVSEVRPSEYDAVFFAGGHGTMWDFPDDASVQRIAASIYEAGGIVAAVCHGPAALVNVRLTDGTYLVADKAVSAFTNDEERAVGLDAVVPFSLADKLVERGARHEPAPNWQENVVVCDRLVTGQNPASATGVAKAMVALLERE